jgi:hypothetical protein
LWRDNTYPGAACDVPSHLYSFSFESHRNWYGDEELSALGEPAVKPYQDPELIPSSFAGILRYSDKTVLAFAGTISNPSNIEVAATYTFAAPFPGDGMFASSVRTPVFRMEVGDDIVPHVVLHGIPLPVEMALKASPELKDVFGNISTTLGYTPVGQLTYGASGQPLRVNVSPAEEKGSSLFSVGYSA